MPNNVARWAIKTTKNAPAVIAIKVHGIIRGPFSGRAGFRVSQAEKAKMPAVIASAMRVEVRERYMMRRCLC